VNVSKQKFAAQIFADVLIARTFRLLFPALGIPIHKIMSNLLR